MARAYTAWVVQEGKGKEATFLVSNFRDWTPTLAKAMQLVRRSDARNVAEFVETGRPVEKQFS